MSGQRLEVVSRRRHRGQSGLTMIELLITVILAAMVLGPITGVAYLVMRQTKPTMQSAEASKQLRLFRTVLADDWSSAAQIVIDPPAWPSSNATCNRGGFTSAPTRIRIALVSSYQVSGQQLRILYRETPNSDGTISLDRQVCLHVLDSPTSWGLGGDPTQGGVYRDDFRLKRVRALVLPPGSTCTSNTVAPFPPCDMNVTVVGADDTLKTPYNPGSPFSSNSQRSTVRLHQQVGPLS